MNSGNKNKKRKNVGIWTAAIAILTCGCVTRQTPTGSPADPELLSYIKGEKGIMIHVDRMFPQDRNMVTLATPYSLVLRNDSVRADLPYWGRTYRPNIQRNNRIENKILEADCRKGKNNQWIQIKVRTPEGIIQYLVTLWPNGKAAIHVHNDYQQPISYQGYFEDKDLD